MNSIIISSLAAFFKCAAEKLQESKVWSIIVKIYGACSRAWNGSAVVRAVTNGGSVGESLIAKWLYLPFTLLELASDKLRGKVSSGIRQSVICDCGRKYVHNFMALNMRFWGITVLCAALTFNALHFALGMGINKYVLILSVLSAGASLCNFNITGFLTTSKAADLVKACAGVEYIRFDFFDEEKTVGRTRLIPAVIIGIITGAVMIYKPLYGAVLPFAVFGMLLVLEYPITGVYAAVFVAPLIPFSSMPLAGICIWTMLSLVIRSFYDDTFKWKRDGLGAVLILFLAVLLISCIFSFARTASLTVWAMYFVFISFYFAITNTVKTREQIYGLLRLFVISGALVALYGVMQYVFGWTTTNAWIDEEMFEDETMRVFSTLANPNVLGEYLLLVLPVSAVFFLKDKAKSLSKWIYLCVTGLVFLCLILTQSRGCWLGFMVSVAVFVTFYEGRLWAIIPFVLCILPFVIPTTIADRLLSIGNMEDTSTSYRVYIWMGAIGILRHYFAGGIGMGEGAFSEVYPFFSYNAIIAPHSHNTFLQLLVEGGIPALAVFIAIILVYFGMVRRINQGFEKKSYDSAMVLALGAGVCGFLLQSMFDYTFYNYRVLAIFFMVIAITAAMGNSAKKGD